MLALLATFAAMGGGSLPALAWASENKMVRLITPYPPGGPVDTAGRRLAEVLGKANGNTYLVDNRSGAGGSIGTAELTRAQPDGNTLGLALPDSLINVVFTQSNPGYDPLKDLTLVAQFTSASPLIIVDPDLKVNTMDELVALAKAKPGLVSYGSWGTGSAPHLIMASLEQLSGAKWLHVPYRGAQPALQDLVGKQVQIGFVPAHVAKIYQDKGWGVPVGVAGPARVEQYPDVATLAEQGYDSAITRSPLWMGVIGPRGMDPAQVQTLAGEIEASLKTPAFVDALAAMSHVPDFKGPEAFQASVREEYAAVEALMKALGVKPE